MGREGVWKNREPLSSMATLEELQRLIFNYESDNTNPGVCVSTNNKNIAESKP